MPYESAGWCLVWHLEAFRVQRHFRILKTVVRVYAYDSCNLPPYART